MNSITRRHFLQGTAASVTAIGLHQVHLFQQADRTLAQGKPGRKIALLIGINNYQVKPLKGCQTDIELQWQLLVHRYGFLPQDILVVADRKYDFLNYKPDAPTRQNILEAYEKHLIAQANSDSTVVFHYSGHGNLIVDPEPLPNLLVTDLQGNRIQVPNTNKATGILSPIDHQTSNPQEINGIMGKTIFLLTAALAKKTSNITTILDSCHSGGSMRNGLVRSQQSENEARLKQITQLELDYQGKWLSDLKLKEPEFQKLRMAGIAAGVAIGSVQYNQLAADAEFEGFHAGALTYTLTRYLWQQGTSESIDAIFSNIAIRAKAIGLKTNTEQIPSFEVNQVDLKQQPVYLSKPIMPFADAIVRQVSNKDKISYWLGGMSTLSLSAAQPGTILSVMNSKGAEIGQIEHRDRKGLLGEGKLIQGQLKDLQVGTILREKVRGLPNDLKLRIALDPSLESDRPSAQTLLSSISRIEVVGSDRSPDYFLSRITPEYKKQFAKTAPDLQEGSIGLFTANFMPIAVKFSQSGDAFPDAVQRLKPVFQSLLATLILKTMGGLDTGNDGRSASIDLEVYATGKVGRQINSNQFAPDTTIQIKIKNSSSEPLHVGVVTIGATGKLQVLYSSSDQEINDGSNKLGRGKQITLPSTEQAYPLSPNPGAIEIMAFSSRESIGNAIRGLRSILDQGENSRTSSASETRQGSDAFSALLGDFDRNSRTRSPDERNVLGVNVNQFSLVSMVIEVVKPV